MWTILFLRGLWRNIIKLLKVIMNIRDRAESLIGPVTVFSIKDIEHITFIKG